MTLSCTTVAAGSVVGREHLRVGRDGQDGHATALRARLGIAVVTDGCSSGAASEVGARLFATVLVGLVERHAASVEPEDPAAAAERLAAAVVRDLVGELRAVLDVVLRAAPETPGEDARAAALAVQRFLLFGFLAAVLTDEVAIVFGIGDGLVVDGDAVTVLDPGPENAPPYAAYALLPGIPPPSPRVHLARRAEGVQAIAIATDGLADAPPETLRQLAGDPRIAKNPSLLGKRLRVLAEQGAFRDDATIAVLLRRAG